MGLEHAVYSVYSLSFRYKFILNKSSATRKLRLPKIALLTISQNLLLTISYIL